VNHFAYKFVLNLPNCGLVLDFVNQRKEIRKIYAPSELRVHLNIEPHKV